MAEINRLSARGVATISQPGRHADGGNLYLNVQKNTGAKSWIFLYRRDGRQREMGLGSAGPHGVSLAEAREAAAEARRMLARGADPLDARRTARAEAKAKAAAGITFGEYADAFITLHENEWRNAKHRAQWKATLGDAYCADLRKRPLSEITTEDVLGALRPLWSDRRETANRLRMRVEKVLDAARVEGRRAGENPARWRGHLALLLPKGKPAKRHHAAMPWSHVPAFYEALRDREGIAARAVELVILTACRSGEVRGSPVARVRS